MKFAKAPKHFQRQIEWMWTDAPRTSGYTIYPDACCDLIFEVDSNGRGRATLYGSPQEAEFHHRSPHTRTFSLRFEPGYLPGEFGIEGGETVGLIAPVERIGGESVNSILQRLAGCKNDGEGFTVLSDFAKTLRYSPDGIFPELISRLKKGMALDDLKETSGYSVRQLERGFRRHVGFTPKQFQKILRFQGLYRSLLKSHQSIDLAQLALEHGYYDQSHMTNEFRRVTGYSPKSFFKKRI